MQSFRPHSRGVAPGAPWARAEPEAALCAPRVLVVDDSEVIRSLIVLNLELEGFTVAADGQECLERVAEVAPNLITMDVAMPRLDGFDTVSRLRSDPATAGIPVVMVTARTQQADRARGAELGINGFITKPFDPGELVETVRSVVEQVRPEGPPIRWMGDS